MWNFLSICVIVWGITKMYIAHAEKSKAVEVAHEKEFWGNDKDEDTEEQIENIWDAISDLRIEIKQLSEELIKELNYGEKSV